MLKSITLLILGYFAIVALYLFLGLILIIIDVRFFDYTLTDSRFYIWYGKLGDKLFWYI